MVLNGKPTGTTTSIPAGLAVGAAVSMGSTLLLAAIIAKLVDQEKLPWENVGYGIAGLLVLSSFLGAIAAYGRIKRQRMLICMASGIIYLGVLLALTALFFGGQYEAVGVTAALILSGSAAAGVLGLKEGKRRRPGKPYVRRSKALKS